MGAWMKASKSRETGVKFTREFNHGWTQINTDREKDTRLPLQNNFEISAISSQALCSL
jgi:hypothetical protein